MIARQSPRALAVRLLRAIEPWYDWGTVNVSNMDAATAADEVHGEVRYFDLQWFGIHLGFQFGRTPRRQPADDPRKHLDARMNELLDELCAFPSISVSSHDPQHPKADDSPGDAVRSTPLDPDPPRIQTTPELALGRGLTSVRGRGAVRDRSSPSPSVAAFARIGGTQAERPGAGGIERQRF